MLFLLALLGIITLLLWRNFIRLYSKAQIALKETLAQPPAPRPQEAPAPLAGLLKDAHIEPVAVGAHCPARGKFIRELGLRTVTGASIVCIERDGVNLVNPGPDEELLEGDQLLLLGTRAQLEKARGHLSGEG